MSGGACFKPTTDLPEGAPCAKIAAQTQPTPQAARVHDASLSLQRPPGVMVPPFVRADRGPRRLRARRDSWHDGADPGGHFQVSRAPNQYGLGRAAGCGRRFEVPGVAAIDWPWQSRPGHAGLQSCRSPWPRSRPGPVAAGRVSCRSAVRTAELYTVRRSPWRTWP